MNKYLLTSLFLITGATFLNAQKNIDNPVDKEINNTLDYRGIPGSIDDKSFLAFSDKGSWFSYSMPTASNFNGFTGPLIMSQENGAWLGSSLVNFQFKDLEKESSNSEIETSFKSTLSGLEFQKKTKNWLLSHRMFFTSAKTAMFQFQFKNLQDQSITIKPMIEGKIFKGDFSLSKAMDFIKVESKINDFYGLLHLPKEIKNSTINLLDTAYTANLKPIKIGAGEAYNFTYSFSYASEFNKNELAAITQLQENFDASYQKTKNQKLETIKAINSKIDNQWQDSTYYQLVQKSLLTLQNNWRSASGGLKYDGFFPSYNYEWFYGFWAWDSWKHAVAVAHFDTDLAKQQVLAMYDYQTENGFIPDCVYRDNLIEENNYRNTKPPLSAWAAWTIFQQDEDRKFIEHIYPKIKKQHDWWYQFRDHDQDGLCEYGSTDGTLIAAKWESGMDNAVRFDDTQLLSNQKNAFSMDQESVDLNSYLFAEKLYLKKLAQLLNMHEEANQFQKEADILKRQIRKQFYSEEDGWYYDTSIDGKSYVKIKGSEGWIPLWAGVASKIQAKELLKTIMHNKRFNTAVPLQTLDASSEKFEPEGGYWRGPTWIDQSYFGVIGLKKYGFHKEANLLTKKLIHNAKGVTKKGSSIRENYNPLTGEGLEAHNFSWSAAHYLLLLLKE